MMCILDQSIEVYGSRYSTKQDNCVVEMTALGQKEHRGVQKAFRIVPSPAGPSQTPDKLETLVMQIGDR